MPSSFLASAHLIRPSAPQGNACYVLSSRMVIQSHRLVRNAQALDRKGQASYSQVLY